MMKILPLLLAVGLVAACQPPAQRSVPPAPRVWSAADLAAPAHAAPAAARPVDASGAYASAKRETPVYLYPEERAVPVEPGEAGTGATLPGAAERFFRGVGFRSGEVRVRAWPSPAYPVSADSGRVTVATVWAPLSTLQREIRCETGGGEARLVGHFAGRGAALVLTSGFEFRGAVGCTGTEAARDRLRALDVDLLRHARETARLAVPVPFRRP